MKFQNTTVADDFIESAIHGMRNAMKSWAKSDSMWLNGKFIIGEKDLDLAHKLLNTNSDSDSKFMRMIPVTVDITAPAYFCSELDTYKIGTTRNSSSIQHTGVKDYYSEKDFTFDSIKGYNLDSIELANNVNKIIDIVNKYRYLYKTTGDYKYFRLMRQFMPMGINYTFTFSANYAVLRNIWKQRRNHPLAEWHMFCDWIATLPYAENLIIYKRKDTKDV